jgi:hypothetical protein
MVRSTRGLTMMLLAFASVALGGARVGSAQGSGLNAPQLLAVHIEDPWQEVGNRRTRPAARAPSQREPLRMEETIDPWAAPSEKLARPATRRPLVATPEILNPWPARPRGTWATRREIIDPWAASPR